MSKYNKKHYLEDLKSPEMLHIKDKERFRNFYEEQGKEQIQKNQQVVPDRIKFIKPKGKMIELGCHCGFNSIHYAKLGYEIIGVDISSTLIEEANRRLSGCSEDVKSRCKFIRSDIEDLDRNFIEKEGLFDSVILTEILEHCIDPDKIIKVAISLLKEGGQVFISAPAIRIGTYAHVRGITKQYLIEQMSIHNLKYEVWTTKKGYAEVYCVGTKESEK